MEKSAIFQSFAQVCYMWLSGNVRDLLKRPNLSLSGHKWPLLHNQPISIPWVLFPLEGGCGGGVIDAEALCK